jgi:hypothetical protein
MTRQKIACSSANSSIIAGECGQTTTEFVTAAERQGPRHRALLALASWAGVCWGCGTFVTATPINPPPRPLLPRAPESVQVLASAPPSEPHVDVALLEVTQSEGWNREGMDFMIQRLREKAAELGCDAVYVKNTSAHEGEDPLLDPDRAELLASCIVFTPPGASPAALETAGTPKMQLTPGSR